MNQDPEGIPKRLVLLAFFALVLVCAFFFTLGFVLGRRGRSPDNPPATERVSPSSDIPPAVNPPAEPQPSTAPEEAGGAAAPATGPPAPSSAPEHPQASAQTELAPASAPAARSPKNGTSPRTAQHLTGEASNTHQTGTAAVPVRTKLPPGLTVQVSALSSQQDAVNMVQVLKSHGYPALLLTPDPAQSKDVFYRIIVGPYKTRRQVEEARNKLAAEGFKPFIRQ